MKPSVPWVELYQCYGSSERCGPLMRSLWEGARPALGVVNQQRLHLTVGLITLLTEWIKSSTSADLAALAVTLRELGVLADLDRMVTELDDQGTLVRDNTAKLIDMYCGQLRQLQQEVLRIGQIA